MSNKINVMLDLKNTFVSFKTKKIDDNHYSLFGASVQGVYFFISILSKNELDELTELGFFDELQG